MRFRTIAIVVALLAGALWTVLSGWTSANLLNWLDSLSPSEQSTLRTVIILSGALIPVLGVVLRRGKAEVDDDDKA